MGLFEKRRKAKQRRIETRQQAKTERVNSRTERQIGKASFGIDTGSAIAGASGNALSSFFASQSLGGMIGGLPGQQNTGVSVTSGSDATKGYIPIIAAIGVVIFFIFSFGKLKRK